MPLNWNALYSQIPNVAKAEVARRLRAAEQATALAEELAEACLARGGTEPALDERQAALSWLGTALRAWADVLVCYQSDSPDFAAAGLRRQQVQQLLLRLLRKAG